METDLLSNIMADLNIKGVARTLILLAEALLIITHVEHTNFWPHLFSLLKPYPLWWSYHDQGQFLVSTS